MTPLPPPRPCTALSLSLSSAVSSVLLLPPLSLSAPRSPRAATSWSQRHLSLPMSWPLGLWALSLCNPTDVWRRQGGGRGLDVRFCWGEDQRLGLRVELGDREQRARGASGQGDNPWPGPASSVSLPPVPLLLWLSTAHCPPPTPSSADIQGPPPGLLRRACISPSLEGVMMGLCGAWPGPRDI